MKRVLIASHASLFPPEHGGAKNIRHIVEGLARSGVDCRVLVKLHPPVPNRIRFAGQHKSGLTDFGATQSWNHLGVTYFGVEGESADLARATGEQIQSFNPDAVFVCDDSLDDGQGLFEVAAESGRLVFLAQTIHCLPFGPYSMKSSDPIAVALRKAMKIIAPSHFVKTYIETHLGKPATVYYPDVFGMPPFSRVGNYKNRFITMINPCPWKGSSILLNLARRRPDLEFAAVPTWGATEPILDELRALPNVTLLEETPRIDEIFAQTRVLLVPSLCQEAFGLVSPEALLRGVPVVASDIAGLRESTLGAAALIPVKPLPFDGARDGSDHTKFVWTEPENPIDPWSDAIDRILDDEETYADISARGLLAAESFVSELGKRHFSELLN